MTPLVTQGKLVTPPEWSQRETEAFIAHRASVEHAAACAVSADDRAACTCGKQTPLDDFVAGMVHAMRMNYGEAAIAEALEKAKADVLDYCLARSKEDDAEHAAALRAKEERIADLEKEVAYLTRTAGECGVTWDEWGHARLAALREEKK